MRIIYSPFYLGHYYRNMQTQQVALDVQVLETQGLLSQLALHAGIHQQIPSFPERLTAYHKALLEYDRAHADNIFHRSIAIDSMSVAKTLLHWRDNLALWGWTAQTTLQDCTRLNTLAEIDSSFADQGLPVLLARLSAQLQLMATGKAIVPQTFRSLVIEISCPQELLPDYIQPLLTSLQQLGTTVEVKADDPTAVPKTITELCFSQQWKAEAWLAQQPREAYDVWLNTDNKRLDNWLHMSGRPVCGSEMTCANPQVTQMFLLAIQLFQRPLNVNTLLQYLFLPECPLDSSLRRELAKVIIGEGGFCNEKVQECINAYIFKEFKADDDLTPQESTKEQREKNYITYLPFDLRTDDSALPLVEETDTVSVKALSKFLKAISSYASHKAEKLSAVQPDDARIAQLRTVAEMTDALLIQLDALVGDECSFTMLNQWAQSLYEGGDYTLYQAQVGSQSLIHRPSNMLDQAANTIWCDFYGDTPVALSTDFLSNNEMQQLKAQGVRFWDPQHESDLLHLMMARPVHQTTDQLTVITCDQQGATKLPMHPLYLQLPFVTRKENGDDLYQSLATKEVVAVDNHRDSDSTQICFDAVKHPVSWRSEESYSALEKLLQNPFDYFMNYTLQFTDSSETDIKLVHTFGNVAHEVVESLFTADRNGEPLDSYVLSHYQEAFSKGLVRKGALLLLPEYHLEKARLTYQLKRCVAKLAAIILQNGLTVIQCEQHELQNLDLEGDILVEGYIDMTLRDSQGRDVVFDLKWTSRKNKYKTVLEKNRALQLAIYQSMLMQHEQHSSAVRTAYFVMPEGKLYSHDLFLGDAFEQVSPQISADIMDQLRNGYAERVREIGEGRIETADNQPVRDLEYANAGNVYPLEDDGKKREPKKAENKYSDYKCFTI